MVGERGSAGRGLLLSILTLIAVVGTLVPPLGVPVFRDLGCMMRGAQYVDFFGAKGCITASDLGIADEPEAAFVPEADVGEVASIPEPEAVTVPDVIGLPATAAESDLAHVGLVAERIDACKLGGAHYPRDVIDQEPAPGTPIYEHDFDATIWVNTARWIPDTIGRTEVAAVERLEHFGFVPTVRYVDDDFDNPGIVTEQPDFAELACPGTVVSILVEISKGYEY